MVKKILAAAAATLNLCFSPETFQHKLFGIVFCHENAKLDDLEKNGCDPASFTVYIQPNQGHNQTFSYRSCTIKHFV